MTLEVSIIQNLANKSLVATEKALDWKAEKYVM